MSSHTIVGRFRAALPLLTLALLAAAPSALPPQVAGDVHESYRVLTTTYYERVDPQALLAAASDALSDLAKKHGVTVAPPQLRVEADPEATLAGLDSAIVGGCRRSAWLGDRLRLRGDRGDGARRRRQVHAVLHAR